MNTIANIDFWGLKPMKYWSFPSTYDPDKRKIEAKTLATSGNYLGSRKMDGAWNMIIKDNEGNFHLRSRNESVNGGFVDKAEWIPHICKELSAIPNNSVIIGEIYFPNNEGSRKITSVLNCLKDKCLERQKAGGYLHYYIFDVLAWDNKNLMNTPFEKRIKYINTIKTTIAETNYIEFAEYYEGEKLWNLYGEVINAGGEGIVITRKDAKYLPNKRTARLTLKMKKELQDTIDVFLDGAYRPPTMQYGGKEIETWDKWYNDKTGEKVDYSKYAEFQRGEPWIPVTKAFYEDWASAVSISVMKDGKPFQIGYISGIPDELKRDIVHAPEKYKGKVYEVSAMEIQFIDGHYSLRHAKFVKPRFDKKPTDCDFAQLKQ